MFKSSLGTGRDGEYRESDDETPGETQTTEAKDDQLHKAVKNKEPLSLIRFLREQVENINELDDQGHTALDYSKRDSEIYKYLKKECGMTATQVNIFQTAKAGNWNEFVRLLDKNTNVDFIQHDNEGNTLLHIVGTVTAARAIIKCVPKEQKMVLFHKINDRSETPWQTAMRKGNVDIVQCIIDAVRDSQAIQPVIPNFTERLCRDCMFLNHDKTTKCEMCYVSTLVAYQEEGEGEEEEKKKKKSNQMLVTLFNQTAKISMLIFFGNKALLALNAWNMINRSNITSTH